MPRVFDKAAITAALKDIPASAIIAAIEEGFVKLSTGTTAGCAPAVQIAPVVHLEFAHGGDCCIKSGFVQEDDFFCVKIASGGFPGGAAGGTMVVFSQVTGQLEAVLLDEGWLTDLRTAAAGALFARYLAPRAVRAIGIVGTGIQARFQLELLKTETACRRVVVWGRSPAKADALVSDIQAGGIFTAKTTMSLEALCRECNLIVTTTSSRTPLLQSEWIQPGTHITAVGADGIGKQELDQLVFARAGLAVADSRRQCCDFGEINHGIKSGVITEGDVVEIGELVGRPDLHRREGDMRITIADSTGVAIQDVQIAKMAYTACSNAARL